MVGKIAIWGGNHMPRQGLTQETVVQAAAALIEAEGIDRFSMGELAKRLDVKPASLYNHVKGVDALLEAVGLSAIGQLVEAERQAIVGKGPEEALFALAEAYRTFARVHNQLYRVIMGKNPVLTNRAGEIVQPILQVLSAYGLTQTQQFHWQRVLRGLMYGFAAHEYAGGFSHFPVDENESYRMAIQWVAQSLRQVKEGNHGQPE